MFAFLVHPVIIARLTFSLFDKRSIYNFPREFLHAFLEARMILSETYIMNLLYSFIIYCIRYKFFLVL